jgi:hypothetical protein
MLATHVTIIIAGVVWVQQGFWNLKQARGSRFQKGIGRIEARTNKSQITTNPNPNAIHTGGRGLKSCPSLKPESKLSLLLSPSFQEGMATAELHGAAARLSSMRETTGEENWSGPVGTTRF